MSIRIKRYPELRALKGKIRAEGTSYRKLAEELNTTASTLCLKINGESDFTSTEVTRICNILHIKNEELVKYFFPIMLPKETYTNFRKVN